MNIALADHYLRSAGIAAICIDADGEVMAYRTIGLELPAGLVCFACLRSDVERLAALARRCRGDQAAIAAQIEQPAGDLYIVPSRRRVARAMRGRFGRPPDPRDASKRRHGAGQPRLQGGARRDAVAPLPRSPERLQLKMVEEVAAQMT